MKVIKKIAIIGLCAVILFTMIGCRFKKPQDNGGNSGDGGEVSNSGGVNMNDFKVNTNELPLKLWYDEEAPFINEGSEKATMMAGQDIGWQNWSLPLGNGFVGVNVFGRTDTERIQVTEKTLSNPWQIVTTENGKNSYPEAAGLNNFSETYIDFGHRFSDVRDYSRDLDLRTAISSTTYKYDGASYSREYFVSYPDNALVIRLDAEDGPLSFTLRPTIPYEQSYMTKPGDGLSKTGTVKSSVEHGIGHIELSGTLGYYDVDFVGYYCVYTNGGSVVADTVEHRYTDKDGSVKTDIDGVIRVENATSAIIVATFGTDYELCAENFENGQYSHNKQTAKTTIDDAREKVQDQLYAVTDAINSMSVDEAYGYLKSRHLADYQELFGRVDLELNSNPDDYNITTDKLLEKYNSGSYTSYLETLLFQYGRYLIIASSREGSLPANLQGAWNCYNAPAWSSGYWSNINIQMNYWHVFTTNLAETFIPYVDYNAAYMPVAEKNASSVIATYNPDVYGLDGGNGWSMSVSGNPFFFNTDRSSGNLGLLTQLFYEYYLFTQDEAVLDLVYDVLTNAARFVTKCVKEYDGLYLVEYCDSPEMYVNGSWYYTTGTTYAQTLAYINNYGALQCAKDLGIDLNNSALLSSEDYSILKTIMEQIDKYDPILVGLSGQIKEFREEDYYGSLGNPNHRHISQLVGLFPGNIINSETEAWLDAALVSLAGRNDGLTDYPGGTTATNEASIVAWAWAHKQALYARAGEGDLAQEMLAGNLRNSTLENLLMVCGKIFQIEASSGTTAAIAEMLLQSDESFIEILPALPTNWDSGAYTGLVARGSTEVSVSWAGGVANKLNVAPKYSGEISIKYPHFANVTVYNSKGEKLNYSLSDDKVLTFNAIGGETYYITGFEKLYRPESPDGFDFERISYGEFQLSWNAVAGADKYNVYVAYENDSSYTFVASTTRNSLKLTAEEGKENLRKTFVVTAVKNGVESERTLCYSNPIELDLELFSLSWSVENGRITATVNATDATKTTRLYAKSVGGSKYVLVAEALGLSVEANYDQSKVYALSVTSKFTGEESLLVELTPKNNAGNIIHDKSFNEHGVANLGAVYSLNELRIYVDFSSVYDSLSVERLYGGEWFSILNLGSPGEVNAYLQGDCLVFDMDGVKANKLRISVDGGVDYNSVTLSGNIVDGEAVEYVNAFYGKEFTPTPISSGNMYSSMYGYQTITDGIVYQESSGRYSSALNGGLVEATISLGRVYSLNELKIYLYKDGLDKFGMGLEIQVLFAGEWKTVVSCSGVAELENHLVKNQGGVGDWLIFELGDVYASKLKFTIPDQNGSGWTTFYEMECYGTPSTKIDPAGGAEPKEPENIFIGKQFIPTSEATASILVASWWKGGGYEALTDGNKSGEGEGRFSTVMSDSGMMDATIDLGGKYTLNNIKFYLYDTKSSITEASKKGSVGKDILIQVYSDGAWRDVVVCSNNAQICQHLVINNGLNNDYLEFDLGGITAEKLRFYISGSASASGTTFQEIECEGLLAN